MTWPNTYQVAGANAGWRCQFRYRGSRRSSGVAQLFSLGHFAHMKYVRYQSQGNTVGIEDGVDDYWEIGDDGYVVRSIHLQPDGSRLKYDCQHEADSLGALPEGVISDEMLADRTVGMITFLTATEFDVEWKMRGKNEPVA